MALTLVAACSDPQGTECDSWPSCAPDPTVPGSTRTFSVRVLNETVVDPAFRQGVARTASGWVFSFNDGLFLTDDAFAKTTELMPAIPDEWKARGFDHLGDIDVVDGLLYAPLEQPDNDKGQQAMLIYDAATLQYRSGIDVAQHHASFVTVDADTGIAYTMDYFGGQALLRYDTRDNWRSSRSVADVGVR